MSSRRLASAALSFAAGMLACTGANDTPTLEPARDAEVSAAVPLIELAAFEMVGDSEDAFARMAPDHISCPPPAYVIETDLGGASTLEVRTDVCNYVTLRQPSQRPIRKGDRLSLLLWHNTLASDVSAEAYVAVAIGDRVAWSMTIPIPSPAASYSPSWRANESVPAGQDVQFHVHNHGANAWRLGDLTLTPAD